MLDLGIDLNVWPWIWLSIAVMFALVELAFVGGTFVLLPFALSAFVAALLAFYDVAIEIQWLTFVGGGGLLFYLVYRWVRGFLKGNTLPVGVGADRLVGTIGTVIVDIAAGDSDRRGRVAIEGEVWGAFTRAGQALTAGTQVRVAAVIGTRVVVESATVRPPSPSHGPPSVSQGPPSLSQGPPSTSQSEFDEREEST